MIVGASPPSSSPSALRAAPVAKGAPAAGPPAKLRPSGADTAMRPGAHGLADGHVVPDARAWYGLLESVGINEHVGHGATHAPSHTCGLPLAGTAGLVAWVVHGR